MLNRSVRACITTWRFIACAVALTILATHVGCTKHCCTVTNESSAEAVATKPESFEWEIGDAASAGLDTASIRNMLGKVEDGTYKNIHSILLVRNGKLVVEEYFSGHEEDGRPQMYQQNTRHGIHSATKSVNSILIGIAIDRHLISGVDAKLSELFPEYAGILAASGKDAIRLKHLLSMTAGLSWDEESHPYTDPRNDHVAMNRSADPIRYVLTRPLVTQPGTKFAYSSGISIVLGELIHKVSGLRADKFAERYLFNPLGITDYVWLKYPNGVIQTGGGLYLRPRDMARIGYLFLNGGRWNGAQIVSEGWVRESTTQQAPDGAYGYQWWLGHLRAGVQTVATYAAQGRGGQYILVFPNLKLVAVFTCWNDGAELREQPIDMLQRFVLPSLIAPNPESNKAR